MICCLRQSAVAGDGISLYDAQTQHPVDQLTGAEGGISNIAYSSDGQLLAGTSQGKVQFWEASSDLPLPVSLSSFRAEQTKTGVVLKWATESELDNAGFYIYPHKHNAPNWKKRISQL